MADGSVAAVTVVRSGHRWELMNAVAATTDAAPLLFDAQSATGPQRFLAESDKEVEA